MAYQVKDNWRFHAQKVKISFRLSNLSLQPFLSVSAKILNKHKNILLVLLNFNGKFETSLTFSKNTNGICKLSFGAVTSFHLAALFLLLSKAMKTFMTLPRRQYLIFQLLSVGALKQRVE